MTARSKPNRRRAPHVIVLTVAAVLMATSIFGDGVGPSDDLFQAPEIVANAVLEKDYGDQISFEITDPAWSQLITRADATTANLILAASAVDFASTSSTYLDLPHPFTFRVFNLAIFTDGTSALKTPATDGLRSCLQIAQLVQLQPEDFSMAIRIDLFQESTVTLDNDWLGVRFQDAGSHSGMFRCSLVSN